MKKLLTLAAAGLFVFAAPAAMAEDHAEHDHGSVGAEVAADAEVTADAAPAPAMATLEDGTQVVIEGEAVYVVAADGTRTPAPDGTHTLSDGSTLTTAGGKIVTPAGEATVEGEAGAEATME